MSAKKKSIKSRRMVGRQVWKLPEYTPHVFRTKEEAAKEYEAIAAHERSIARGYKEAADERSSPRRGMGRWLGVENVALVKRWRTQARKHTLRAEKAEQAARRMRSLGSSHDPSSDWVKAKHMRVIRTSPHEWQVGNRKFKTLRGAEGYWRRQTISERSRQEREGNPIQRDPMTVANTILEQLGGRRFIVMTGAKNLSGEKNSLTFKIPKAKSGITHVKVTLDPSDTYTVRFIKQARAPSFAITTVKEYSDIYADQLRDLFEHTTGLYTRL